MNCIQKTLCTNFIFLFFVLISIPIHSQQDIVKDTSNIPIKTPIFNDNILVDLWAQNSSYIYNLNSGNVGIGTSTNAPPSRLTVWGSGWTNGLEINNGSGHYSRITSAADGLLFRNYSNNTTSFSFRNYLDIKLMVINSNGNVLINKTAQTNLEYKLDVNGKIRANEVVVNTTGADFVFSENYNLIGLNEVETFIKENKHLPEIPNAEEMQQNGMGLSEMNTKLLQKVEELTLYIIDQEKRIKNLEDKNEK